MDEKALALVRMYILRHLDLSDALPEFEVYVVWKCKALQNWKYLISSSLTDGMYYEVTFNGDKCEWYLDAYKKFQNVRIVDEVVEKVAEIKSKYSDFDFGKWATQTVVFK